MRRENQWRHQMFYDEHHIYYVELMIGWYNYNVHLLFWRQKDKWRNLFVYNLGSIWEEKTCDVIKCCMTNTIFIIYVEHMFDWWHHTMCSTLSVKFCRQKDKWRNLVVYNLGSIWGEKTSDDQMLYDEHHIYYVELGWWNYNLQYTYCTVLETETFFVYNLGSIWEEKTSDVIKCCMTYTIFIIYVELMFDWWHHTMCSTLSVKCYRQKDKWRNLVVYNLGLIWEGRKLVMSSYAKMNTSRGDTSSKYSIITAAQNLIVHD